MSETVLKSAPAADETSRHFQVRRLFDMVVRPRATLNALRGLERGAWLTPIAVILALLIVRVLVEAPIKIALAESGAAPPPPGFEFYTPEQQAQIQQALEATRGPVFQYVFPIIGAVLRGLLLWSITAVLLYFISTLQGGRGSLTRSLNLVAWAMLPTIVHLSIQIIATLTTQQLIDEPGLAGFTPSPPEGTILGRALLSRIDFFLFWHMALLVIGLKLFTGLDSRKAWVSVLITIAIVMLLRILPDLIGAQLGGLTIIQPFIF
jgi:hypothetical protein